MDPIPAWVRRLWDIWDLRMLILLSFTLQVILSIFGRRRKYISSVWISVLVWSAYITADWVATVALGKLSDAQGDQEKINALWALWAPLLLLHLGGPDGITAYSLEDNRLWLRHFVGLVVQLFVAVYVILMSWKKSWFSFMSIPALVAGIIKYGERTLVLYRVSKDELGDLPLDRCVDSFSTERHDYVAVVAWAWENLCDLLNRARSGRIGPSDTRLRDTSILLDAEEVSMGFLYDLLYTKATLIKSKGGFIMRFISFGCTVSVLLGLAMETLVLKTKEGEEIDTLVTWVLIVGAVALEIYAAIVIFSSNWMMLWLISQGKEEWVAWLGQRFPCLFNKKKNWSNKVGQFDLLGYLLKMRDDHVKSSPVRNIIRLVLGPTYEDKWNKCRYKSADALVRAVILDRYTHDRHAAIEVIEHWQFSLYASRILEVHLLTEIFYYLEMELELELEDDHHHPSISDNNNNSSSRDHEDDPSRSADREVSKTLSDYMMYLQVMHPSLLPDAGSRRFLEAPLQELGAGLRDMREISGDEGEIKAAYHRLLSINYGGGRIRRAVNCLKGKGKTERWKIIKLMWFKLLFQTIYDIHGFGQKDSHFQRLRQGGELLTLLWFFNPLPPLW